MKAILVKDNDFKTIGFEVTTDEGSRIFNYGISPRSMNYTKEIDVKKYLLKIFELVRLETLIYEQERFVSKFFDVASKNKLVNSVKNADPTIKLSAKFQESDEMIKQNKNEIKRIIDSFI